MATRAQWELEINQKQIEVELDFILKAYIEILANDDHSTITAIAMRLTEFMRDDMTCRQLAYLKMFSDFLHNLTEEELIIRTEHDHNHEMCAAEADIMNSIRKGYENE